MLTSDANRRETSVLCGSPYFRTGKGKRNRIILSLCTVSRSPASTSTRKMLADLQSPIKEAFAGLLEGEERSLINKNPVLPGFCAYKYKFKKESLR